MGNPSYTAPGASSSNSSNKKDQKRITFKFCDRKKTLKVKMYRDDAKKEAWAYSLTKVFLSGIKGGKKDSVFKQVAVFKTPLKNLLSISEEGYHAFILFVVDNYWVTLEKNEQGLTIQISKYFALVAKKHMNKKRATPIKLAVLDDGKGTIQNLATFILEKNFAFEEYDVLGGIHCKKFAEEIFNKFGKTRTYNWKSDETMARGMAATTVATVGAGLIFGPIPAGLAILGGAIITAIQADIEKEKEKVKTDLKKKEEMIQSKRV